MLQNITRTRKIIILIVLLLFVLTTIERQNLFRKKPSINVDEINIKLSEKSTADKNEISWREAKLLFFDRNKVIGKRRKSKKNFYSSNKAFNGPIINLHKFIKSISSKEFHPKLTSSKSRSQLLSFSKLWRSALPIISRKTIAKIKDKQRLTKKEMVNDSKNQYGHGNDSITIQIPIKKASNGHKNKFNVKDLFSSASGEDFEKKKTIVNPHSFNYIVNNENLCRKGPKPLYIIYCLTAPANFERRVIMRQIWSQPNIFPEYPSRLIFILGLSNDLKVNKAIRDEGSKYGDIVQEDFQDHYASLTYKGTYVFIKGLTKKFYIK